MSKKISDMNKDELNVLLKKYTFWKTLFLACFGTIEFVLLIISILMLTDVIYSYRHFNFSHTQIVGFYLVDQTQSRKIKEIKRCINLKEAQANLDKKITQ